MKVTSPYTLIRSNLSTAWFLLGANSLGANNTNHDKIIAIITMVEQALTLLEEFEKEQK